jgi:hypothetical protein
VVEEKVMLDRKFSALPYYHKKVKNNDNKKYQAKAEDNLLCCT